MERVPSADTESLDKAIEHARQTAAMIREENPGCAEEHVQLAEWLEELKFQRANVNRVTDALAKTHERLNEYRRASGTSLDGNIHMRLSISQGGRSWNGAQIVDRVTASHVRMGEQELLLEVGDRLLRDVLGGFIIERKRKGP